MASVLPQLNDPYGRLCSAVGLVFIQWAKLENEMAASLRAHLQRQGKNSARTYALAAAIYGSMRMKAARDTMKRIAQELDYGEKALAFHEEFFSHIGHIENFRDKLAHQIVSRANAEYDDWWIVTDIVTSRTVRSLKIYEFHTNAIIAAAFDLNLAALTVGDFLRKGARRSAPRLPAWRYKSSMLAFRPNKRLPTLPEPQPLPDAFFVSPKPQRSQRKR